MTMQKKRSGRASRRAAIENAGYAFKPTLRRGIPRYDLLSEASLDRIHDAAMSILSEVGIEFHDDESLELWKQAGANVDGQRVRMPEDILMDLIAKSPETFEYCARNPERSVTVGGDNMIFANSYGAPFVYDLDGVRRRATLEDTNNFFKLAYMSPALHVTGILPVEPQDIEIDHRHLHMLYGALKYSDKPVMGAVGSAQQAQDSIDMVKIVFGEDFVSENTVITGLCNCNSPLVWDETMLAALKTYARNNQAVLCTPFVLAGASTPASTVGGVAQLIAEGLAGIALGQLVRPGSPMILGVAIFGVSMKSGAPTFGCPEPAQMNLIVGQLARRYGVPWRSCTMWSASKAVDIQAGYDAIFSTFPVMMAGCNFMMHAAGMIEGGLALDYSKFVLDADELQSLYNFFSGVKENDLDEAIDAIREVGPANHFLGTEHTRTHRFHMPDMQDDNSFEQWEADGSLDGYARGIKVARQKLQDYKPPSMDPAIDDALLAFVRNRENGQPQ